MTIIQKHLEVYENTIDMHQLLKNNGVIIDFLDDPDSASFKSKKKITDETGSDGKK